MKKRALAILLVLVMVTAGLFAVAMPDNATATLRATLGEYLMHGFTNSSNVKYQPSITIEDAFGTAAPSFKYGYKTNSAVGLTFKMAVGNFVNQTVAGTVRIASVTSSNSGFTPTYDSGYYTIFTTPPGAVEKVNETTITIYPAKEAATTDHTGLTAIGSTEFAGNPNAPGGATGAPAGTYVAEITFSVIVTQ